MNKIQIKRLEKLATHLERGKLGHEEFNFSVVNSGQEKPNVCGTAGCALGEMPIVFPRSWAFKDNAIRHKKHKESNHFYPDVRLFFGINEGESCHLFEPYTQDTWRYGGEQLFRCATREEVASNIRAFLKIKTK